MRGEGWVCTGADSVVWQKQLGKLLPALASPIPCCLHSALCARAPCRSCTSCSWPEGQVLLFLSFFHQSFCLLKPELLSPIICVRKRGLDPAVSHTAHTHQQLKAQACGYTCLAPSQLLSTCWVFSSEEQQCHTNLSALFCFPLARPALCMAEGLPAILFYSQNIFQRKLS